MTAAVTLSPNGQAHYHLAGPPENVLVATTDGVVTVRTIAGEWQVAERGLRGLHVSSLVADQVRNVVYAGTHGEGVFRQRGGGDWQAASGGLESLNVFSLALTDDERGHVLYAGTEPAYLYRSGDEAQAWHELPALRAVPGREIWDFPPPPHIAHAKHVDVDPRDSRILYLAIEQGALLKSVDGGQTFRELAFSDETYVLNKDVHRVVFNPHDPDELFVTGGDGIAHSTDAGETWDHLATPAMRIAYPDAAFHSPEEDGVVFVAGGGTAPDKWRKTGDAQATMVRSRDGGRHWEVLPLPPLRGNIEAATLVSWPGGFGFLAGTTDGEVYASNDRGESWSLIAAGLAAVSKCGHHRNLLMGRGAA